MHASRRPRAVAMENHSRRLRDFCRYLAHRVRSGAQAFPIPSEENAAQSIRLATIGVAINGSFLSSPHLQYCLCSLEGFVSQIFHEINILTDDSLDGIYAEIAEKTSDRQIRLLGHCIFISDQTLTPIEILARISCDSDEFEWCDCRLGEIGPNGMKRTPYDSTIRQVAWRYNEMQWCHHFGYGERTEEMKAK